MLNRRNFFKFLGKATLGTIIALNIPDSLVPTLLIEDIGSIPISQKLSNKLFGSGTYQFVRFVDKTYGFRRINV